MDVLEIDGASNRGIDEIRDLREKIRYVPTQGKYKIYIIDEVHMLTPEAFNALLKTLEEPPPNVIFIFATTEPSKLPPTVLSRCQRFDFRRIKPQRIVERLKAIVEEEKIAVAPEALLLLSQKADGSVRDAESLLDQLISYSGNNATLEDAKIVLGLVSSEILFDLIDFTAQKDSRALLELLGKIIEDGYDLREVALGLLEILRNLLLVKIGVESLEGISGTEQKCYQEEAAKFSVPDLLKMIKIVSELEIDLRRTPQPRILFEVALVRMVQLESPAFSEEMISQPPQFQGKKESNRFISQERSENGRAKILQTEEKEITREKLEEVWKEIVERVKRKRMSLGSFLEFSKPIGLREGVVWLTFPPQNSFLREQIETSKFKKIIEEEISAVLGVPLRVACQGEEGLSSERSRLERVKKTSSDEMGIQKLLQTFDGEIV